MEYAQMVINIFCIHFHLMWTLYIKHFLWILILLEHMFINPPFIIFLTADNFPLLQPVNIAVGGYITM